MTMGTRIVVMKDGDIQQIDTPQNVYDYPANTFVARFIGSPQMNITEGFVQENDDRIEIVLSEDTIINVSEEKEKLIKDKGYVGKKILVGFRPENLHETEVDKLISHYSTINAIVEVSELMGSETYLYMNRFGNN